MVGGPDGLNSIIAYAVPMELTFDALPYRDLPVRLRAATRAAHRRLDHHPLLAPLILPTPTWAQYRRALLGLLALHQPLQASVIAELAQLGLDYPLQDRVALLRADLAALAGEAWAEPPEAGLALPPTGHIDGLIGRLYVLEGSRLGGRVIAHRLRASLGLNAQNGASFFTHDGLPDQPPPAWPTFWRWALLLVRDEQAIIAGALDAFAGCAERLDGLARRLGQASDDVAP